MNPTSQLSAGDRHLLVTALIGLGRRRANPAVVDQLVEIAGKLGIRQDLVDRAPDWTVGQLDWAATTAEGGAW